MPLSNVPADAGAASAARAAAIRKFLVFILQPRQGERQSFSTRRALPAKAYGYRAAGRNS
jgi:hypothetical protein